MQSNPCEIVSFFAPSIHCKTFVFVFVVILVAVLVVVILAAVVVVVVFPIQPLGPCVHRKKTDQTLEWNPL